MRHNPIPSALFVENRKKFTAQMESGSIAIFVSNDLSSRNGDQTYWPYRQNSELYWLTGISQDNTFLILFPDSPNPKFCEILFVTETNEQIATWEGHKLSKEQASINTGIETVLWNRDFQGQLAPLLKYAKSCYLNTNENDRYAPTNETAEVRFAKKISQENPTLRIERSAPILNTIRSLKHSIEIEFLQKAIEITKNAWLASLKDIKAGLMEYQLESLLIKEILWRGGNGFSFEPIIAGGKNACVLHYITNDQVLLDGDLILMDFGADYGYYSGDMTRCVPVNGKYSARQKEVYNTVLHVMREAKKLLRPGITLNEYNVQSALIMEQALIKLGLISASDLKNQDPSWPAYKEYFPHGTGHFLGIDVHDIGERYGKLEAGMIITCEPGIYIKKEGIGIRIENDILIGENGPIDLMERVNVPIEIEEIESLIN